MLHSFLSARELISQAREQIIDVATKREILELIETRNHLSLQVYSIKQGENPSNV